MLNEIKKIGLNTCHILIGFLKVKSQRKDKKTLLRNAILSGGIRRVK